MIWILLGYMWLFVHRPFEVWPWLGAYRIERVYMLATLICWLFAQKTWTPCRSHFPVFLLATTYLFASQTSSYATFKDVEDWFKVFVFYILVVTVASTARDLRILVCAFVVITALYQLHSLREYFNGRGVYRMGTWRMVGVDVTMSDPNSFGASINYALPMLYPVWTIARKRWQQLAVIAMAGLAVVCVLLTGSRSAFMAVIVLAVAGAATSRYRWRILATLAVAAPLVWSCLSADLQDRYLTLIDPSRGPQNARESAEGRSKSFWDGMHSFAENPLFGAGLESYRAHTGFATHNLYNQALGELGLPGLCVLLGFAWCFVANFRESRTLIRSRADPDALFCFYVVAASMAACVAMFLLGWGAHNLSRYNWLWFGAFSGLALSCLRIGHRYDDQPDTWEAHRHLQESQYSDDEPYALQYR